MKIRVGTFNVENLFLRYRRLDNERGTMRKKPIDWAAALKDDKIIINYLRWQIDDIGPISKSLRELTAKVILENKPDILALQEVENLEALIQFNRKYLKNYFDYAAVLDGNDLRQIDVGLLSRYPIERLKSNRFDPPEEKNPTKKIFSRDCLEATVSVASGKEITLLVNHFKSKIGGGEDRRLRQAKRVAEILKDRFGAKLNGNFIVCGDLNAGPESDELKPLLSLGKLGMENVIERLGENERWTHYYKKEKKAEQLDYLLLSPELAKKNPRSKPYVERRGLPIDIDYYEGVRFNKKLKGKEGASDHCAIFFEINI